jgi:hypothetical protein
LCIEHNASQYEKYARQSDSIAPHLILGGIRMRISQPLADLLLGLLLGARRNDPAVGFPDFCPKSNILIGGIGSG